MDLSQFLAPIHRYRIISLILLFLVLVTLFSFIHISGESFNGLIIPGKHKTQDLIQVRASQNSNGTSLHRNYLDMGLGQELSGDIAKLPKNATSDMTTAFPLRVIFNRVGKCGSRTVLKVMERLSHRNHFNMYASTIYNKTHLNLLEQITLANNLHKMEMPFIYQRHLHYLDFAKFDSTSPSYINIIRDPLSRMVSQYYFRRFGNVNSKELPLTYKGTEEDRQRSFDECVLKDYPECHRTFYIIPFFCGHHPNCRQPSQWALEKAQQNVIEKFLLVGILEKLDETFVMLEKLLPDMFSGANATYQEILLSELNTHTATKFKKTPTQYVQKIMKERLKFEYIFYNFVVNLFQQIKKQITAVNV